MSVVHPLQTPTAIPCEVKVVLLCKTRGGDPDSYRPNRDETQWVGRRDALVRCVTSFLFGPVMMGMMTEQNGNADNADNTATDAGTDAFVSREIIMLFDDDLAQLRMSVNSSSNNISNGKNRFKHPVMPVVVPTEQKILQLWKRAAQRPKQVICMDGMTCCITPDPLRSMELHSSINTNTNTNTNTSSVVSSSSSKFKSKSPSSSSSLSLPPGLDSKRLLLEYLQKNCSIEFLRSKGLNSSPDVILRKTNKKKLMDVWNAWSKERLQGRSKSQSISKSAHPYSGSKKTASSSSLFNEEVSTEEQKRRQVIEEIYAEILDDNKDEDGKTATKESNTQIVAGILHETCPEFPCFGLDSIPPCNGNDNENDNDLHQNHNHSRSRIRRYKMFLFLGAVRDMTSMENDTLATICNKTNIPLIGVRFGTVPEFTSKILSILAFHHAHNVLGGAVRRLLLDLDIDKQRQRGRVEKNRTIMSNGKSLSQKQPRPRFRTCLHVICTVPIPSTHLSTDLKDRDRIHWCLVRVIVCTLWRSRLVSSSSSSSSPTSPTVDHSNTLCLIFSDRVVVHLSEEGFVQKMAERHQAAPSEYQVLNTLKETMDSTSTTMSGSTSSSTVQGSMKNKKMAKFILGAIEDKLPIPITSMICLGEIPVGKSKRPSSSDSLGSSSDPMMLTRRFYSDEKQSHDTNNASDRGIIALLSVGMDSKKSIFARSDSDTDTADAKSSSLDEGKFIKALISASAKRNIVIHHETMCMQKAIQDREAASIVCVQHFCHQNRIHFEEEGSLSRSRGVKRKFENSSSV